MPCTYCIYLSKARGKAKKCGSEQIEKGDLRVGSMNLESGSYGNWVHLDCWRVPGKIHVGLEKEEWANSSTEILSLYLQNLNEVLLSGFEELTEQQQDMFIEHTRDEANWAKLQPFKSKDDAGMVMHKQTGIRDTSGSQAPFETSAGPASTSTSTSIVPAQSNAVSVKKKERYIIPVPGRNGAVENKFYGKTCVLTGDKIPR